MDRSANKLMVAIMIILGIAALIGCDKNDITNDDDNQNIDEKLWVHCYHPCYQWYPEKNIPWDQITHLTLGYMVLFENEQNQWDIKVPDGFYYGQDGWFDKSDEFIASGHQSGDKIICMLGGAGSNVGNSNEFWNMATTFENVGTFAASIKALLQPAGFDGVDLDWEENVDNAGFLKLVKELRKIWPDAIITIPTGPAGGDAAGLAPCNEYVDAFMPMSYMSVMQWSGWILPVPPTPLYAYEGNPYSVELTLNKWITAGVPASKIVMGAGGYGQVWGDSNQDGLAPNEPYCSTTTEKPNGEGYAIYSDNTVTQEWVSQTIADHPELVENWDDVGKCSYWSSPAPDNLVNTTIRNGQSVVDVGLIFYETEKSMEYKVDYINDNGMKGIMFWTLLMLKDADDTYPILKMIKDLEAQNK